MKVKGIVFFCIYLSSVCVCVSMCMWVCTCMYLFHFSVLFLCMYRINGQSNRWSNLVATQCTRRA